MEVSIEQKTELGAGGIGRESCGAAKEGGHVPVGNTGAV